MKKLIIALVMLLVSVPCMWGQSGEMSVREFYLDPMDLTANTPGTMEYDQNGTLAALIKIQTVEEGFTFDPGMLGVVKTKKMPGEIYLYLPDGTRKLSIGHPKFGTILSYQFPSSLERGKTYILRLNLPKTERKYDDTRRQKMVLQVDPPTATVRVNGMPQNQSPTGRYEGDYSLGLYDITVFNEGYHTQEITVNLNDQSKTFNKEMRLKPKFGWLTIKGEGDETVYIEGKKYPVSSVSSLKLDTGNYSLKIEKPLHATYESTFEMQDSLLLTLAPSLVPIYKDLTFTADAGSQIWIDGKMVGTGTYRDKIVYGTYEIEARKEKHRPAVISLTVDENTPAVVAIGAPVQICGTLKIDSTPVGSDVYIDGLHVGKTPFARDLLIGQHTFTVRRLGYKDYTANATLEDGKVNYVHAIMDQTMNAKISANVDASLYIDDKYIGEVPAASPLSTEVIGGLHKVKLTADGYLPKSKDVNFDISGMTHTFKLRKDPLESRGFELGANCYLTPDGAVLTGYLGLTLFKYVYVGSEISDQLFGGHAGLNFKLGNGFMARPLCGLMTDQYYDGGSYITPAVRLSYAPVKCLEFAVTPQYWAPLDPTTGNNRFSGFSCSVGIVVYLSSHSSLLLAGGAAALLLL